MPKENEEKEEHLTQTAEGIPVGTSPEEERLGDLHRAGRLPEAAKRRGVPGEEPGRGQDAE